MRSSGTRLSVSLLLFSMAAFAPGGGSSSTDYDESLYQALRWRQIGPFRGGRVAAVAGIPSQRDTYYFGGTGGGVWKTTDGGRSWKNVSGEFFGGSIGAVAVSEWDPNVVYAGGGECTVRGNVSPGDGIWRSTDAGKTWVHCGLEESQHVPRIRIHPRDPDLVYVAALGHLFGPNEQRGVYRSEDGGKTWKRILYAGENAGAFDLCLDPGNPRILYASTWRVRRTPYGLESGGEGSGLWKSSDGGDSWKELTRNKGLPEGTVGVIGVAVSPVRSERVWAIVEAEKGGVFRSDDGGETWRKLNDERKLRQRAWYYTRIYADTQDVDQVYVVNVRFWRSKDGGKTFQSLSTPHADNHDLWIDPNDSLRMVEGNDGGANVSYDGGRTWSRQDNQPTAQFYRVTTDNHFPYRIYGAQQDNSTVRIPHRTRGRGIGLRDWESTAGGESGHIAPHPLDPDIVYGGSYDGFLVRRNHKTGEYRRIDVWPENPMGWGAAELEYRFQWNFPIFFSPHDPKVLYTAANVLFRTTDEGQSWQMISPDLTRNDKTKMGPSGGPITKDNTSVEYYGTIFAALESPFEKGTIWCGSDDGRLHLTRNGGETWTEVTPKGMPEWIQINSIEAHPFEEGGLYVAATMYKSDDFRPYLYRTTDYGRSWTKITRGIDAKHFTRVIRADPKRRGLLYAGTERGVYVSFDDGVDWKPFQQGLPITPITDLAIKNDDLIAATQGRSFWVLDDLTPLHQLSPEVEKSEAHLFAPRPSYRMRGRSSRRGKAGTNPPSGVVFHYLLSSALEGKKGEAEKKVPVELEILESDGTLIKSFSSEAKKGEKKLPAKQGMNRFVWDMRYPDAKTFEGMVLWGGGTRGPRAVPGRYKARLSLGNTSVEQGFEILADPRSGATEADYRAQFACLIEIRDKLSEVHESITRIRALRAQLKALDGRIQKLGKGEGLAEIRDASKKMRERILAIEKALYQTRNRSRQDPLNFPIRLNNKLSALAGVVAAGDYPPTDGALRVKTRVIAAIDVELGKLRGVLDEELPAFNRKVGEQDIPSILLAGHDAGQAEASGKK